MEVYLLLEEVSYEPTTVLGVFSTFEKANEYKNLFRSDYPYYGIYKLELDNLIKGNIQDFEIIKS